MNYRNLTPLAVLTVLVISCFLPWLTIESKSITISGVDTSGTRFGKPAYFHFFWTGLYLLFYFIPKVWSRRAALGMLAFNLAWAFRNFMLLPACQMGECPEREIGLYLLFGASLILFIAELIRNNTKIAG